MALTKVLTGGIALDAVDNTILKLDDDYALTGTVSGTSPLEKIHEVVVTDYMGNQDYSITDAWKTYRQALRDITSQTPSDDTLSNITFPTKPS